MSSCVFVGVFICADTGDGANGLTGGCQARAPKMKGMTVMEGERGEE